MTLDEFLSRFNLSGVIALDDTIFEALKKVALQRWEAVFGQPYPSTPTNLDQEILMHFLLLEVLKTFNYLTSENSQKFSINKVAEHTERLIWLKRNSETQTS